MRTTKWQRRWKKITNINGSKQNFSMLTQLQWDKCMSILYIQDTSQNGQVSILSILPILYIVSNYTQYTPCGCLKWKMCLFCIFRKTETDKCLFCLFCILCLFIHNIHRGYLSNLHIVSILYIQDTWKNGH